MGRTVETVVKATQNTELPTRPKSPKEVSQAAASQTPVTSVPTGVPATTENLRPYTIADVNKIFHRIGDPYFSQHPNATPEELRAAINNELAREGYKFRVKQIPRFGHNPPSLFGGGEGIHLTFSGVTLEDTAPHNGMTGVATGKRSPVTLNDSSINGFDKAIKTGDDSPVELHHSQLASPQPENQQTCSTGSVCNLNSPNSGTQTVNNGTPPLEIRASAQVQQQTNDPNRPYATTFTISTNVVADIGDLRLICSGPVISASMDRISSHEWEVGKSAPDPNDPNTVIYPVKPELLEPNRQIKVAVYSESPVRVISGTASGQQIKF